MNFKENAEVFTQDMNKIGHLNRVVVDPATEEVTHLVVEKGFLFTEDRVVLATYIDTAERDRIVLKEDAPRPDAYPEFEETQFVPIGSFEDFRDKPSQDARKLLWYHTSVRLPGEHNLYYPAQADKPLFHKEKKRNIPDDTVALEEGASVTDTAGSHLGQIQAVFTEKENLTVTHILVVSGLIKKEPTLIPVNWIKQISEDSVQLYLRKETFENLSHADAVMKNP